MADPNEAGRNARAVYFVDTAGNPLIPVTAPTAAALADATANPTTSLLGALNYGYNGATWDRLRTKGTGNLAATLVDGATGTAVNTDSGEAVDALAAANLALHVQAAMKGWNGATWDRLRVSALKDLMVQQRHATAWQSATGTAGAAVTLTIPAGAAGVFNYLCYLQIVKFAAALLTAAATPVLVTTTGMTGTPTFSFSADAAAQGTEQEQKYEGHDPIVGSAAATTLTVVCPATTGVIWRVNATYFQA
jgi:hypothetical protein